MEAVEKAQSLKARVVVVVVVHKQALPNLFLDNLLSVGVALERDNSLVADQDLDNCLTLLWLFCHSRHIAEVAHCYTLMESFRTRTKERHLLAVKEEHCPYRSSRLHQDR